MGLFNVKETTPTRGYILKNWNYGNAYRSTAIAYLERENLYSVEHINGRWYTLYELKNSRII
jgi:hypothetical protein